MSQKGSSLSPLVLLVLLGAAMAGVIPHQFVSENLHKTLNSIEDVLKLKEPEVGGKPLFDSVIKCNSCQRKAQVMNATLNVYSRIFSSLLQSEQQARVPLLDQLKSGERTLVKLALKELKQKMEVLGRSFGQLNPDKEDVLSNLMNITVDDPLVQRKALAEFKMVYQAAAVIGSSKCGHAHSSSHH
ncbi:uncharacterized protein ACO6RY_14563 [Pungitius sinensis]